MGVRFTCPKCNAVIILDNKSASKHGFMTEVSAKIPDYDPAKPSNTIDDFVGGADDPWGQHSKPAKKPVKQNKAGVEEFDIAGYLKAETDKAYGVQIHGSGLDQEDLGGDKEELTWLPKSLTVDAGEEAGLHYFTIPLWLAQKKGFAE